MGDTYSKIDTGFYYLRVDNLGTNGFVVGNLKWLNLETFETLKRYQICTGDVLISIAGSIGRAAVFDESSTAGSTVLTENCAKLHLGANVLPEYFRLILSSTVLQAQMQRDYIQTTIPKLGLDRIRQLRIPKIPEISRQMEVIASWKKAFEIYETTILDASTRLAGIDDYLLGVLGIVLPEKVENTIANRIFKTTRRELTGWRFDPQALHPEREAAIHEVKKLQARPLKQVVLFCKNLVVEVPEDAVYIGLENIVSDTGRYVPSNEKESISSAFIFRNGQVLFPKLRPYLNKVFLAPFDGLCSTEFHVFQGVSVSSEFLTLFLRSQIVVNQTKHLMSGNTLPRLQTEDIEEILIPDVSSELQAKIVREALHRMKDAEELRKRAEAELGVAKRRIEALLLGASE